jgi:toxin ParE1/3/4
MTYRLVQRTSARRDILDIIDHIATQNPAAAERVYAAYEATLELLRRTPDIGRLYDSADPRLAGVRMLPIQRYHTYLLFHRRAGDVVEVLHVWHGARDIAALWRTDDESRG